MSLHDKNLKIGIISLGSMGAGIAHLLTAHGYSVASNCVGRSEDTLARARRAQVELLPSDTDLVQQCRLIFSIVPPGDAAATAQRIVEAMSGDDTIKEDVYFVDMNAVSPRTCRSIASNIEKSRLPIKFIDGCILGGPPKPKTPSPGETSDGSAWYCPRMPVSGPHDISSLPHGTEIASLLKWRQVSPAVGAASGLKMCFASISKGLIGIATQSMSAAHSMGVLDDLRLELEMLNPQMLAHLERIMPGMPPKAYRWVKEMEEIDDTFVEEGAWQTGLFRAMADVYRAVAADGVLGAETSENRKRGRDITDMAECVSEGLQRKRKKNE